MKHHPLPLSTEIEVIARKGDIIKKKLMSYGEALKLKGDWKYDFFQVGFSAYKLT